jgi:ankyrin repeat protein
MNVNLILINEKKSSVDYLSSIHYQFQGSWTSHALERPPCRQGISIWKHAASLFGINMTYTYSRYSLTNNDCVAYCKDVEGSPPIHVVVANGNLDFINLFLEYCPYYNWSCNNFVQTILHTIIQNNHYNVVRYVRPGQKFVRIFNTRDIGGNIVLHLAIMQGNESIFCQLMRRNEASVRAMCSLREPSPPSPRFLLPKTYPKLTFLAKNTLYLAYCRALV